ncbi:hypothetical protein [Ideonella sp. YS5]|uniref:hypothetical protein n=1 Tax=Ideonella sp. YS5 TaxID=3453714 RepID=UPI003EE9C393
MNDKTQRTAEAGLRVETPRPPGPGEPGRIEWLFRDAARERRIHPLMRLVQDYRRSAAGKPPC